MRPETERKKYYGEKLHKRKNRLHAHLSTDLRKKLKIKTRSLLVRKGDTVKVMRGQQKGKEAKISKVDIIKRKIYLEGTTVNNARGNEVFVPFEVSNLMLVNLEPTPERKKVFSEDAFAKKEAKVPAKAKTQATKDTKETKAKTKEPAKKAEKIEPEADKPEKEGQNAPTEPSKK